MQTLAAVEGADHRVALGGRARSPTYSRNLDDEQLLALKKNGGVIQIVAFASYVKTDSAGARAGARRAARGVQACRRARRSAGAADADGGAAPGAAGAPARRAPARAARRCAAGGCAAGGRGGRAAGGRAADAASALGRRSPTSSAPISRPKLAEIDAKFPPPARATVKDFVDHIDYAVKLIGIDHVGISSDFDGGGGVDGWNGADETFNVTLELVRRGYTEEQIGKIWSGNLLRVMDQVQRIAKDLQKGTK